MQQFSVLLSIYNKENASFLRECLDSIFQQTLLPDEVVLVKDGPLYEELDEIITEYANKYLEFKIISLKENKGLGYALNVGLQHCSYDLVARMDTDDVAKYDRFEKQIRIMRGDLKFDVVGAWVDEFEENVFNVISVRKLPETSEEIYSFAKSRNPINHPVVMFKKQAVIDAGGYQHCPFFEDYYLWVRMLMNGSEFYNIQESLLYFRFSSAMFKRRGGWKYTIYEWRFQYMIRKMRFISFYQFSKNIFIRSITRLLPNSLRTVLYKRVLRG